MKNIWWTQSKDTNFNWAGKLEAYWEVENSSISDDYDPYDMNASELFSIWLEKVKVRFTNDLIPVYWFVVCQEHHQLEAMPFQYEHVEGLSDFTFLNHYRWPIHAQTTHPLNWFSLPVVDKFWNKKQADKGGFIQEYTGWKPGILQPFVYLPSLLYAFDLNQNEQL